MTNWNEYHNPFYIWWKVRKIFKRPKCHVYIGKKTWFFGLAILDCYYNPIISIKFRALGWKWKYDDVRHEWDPYIQIRLFRKWDIIFIFNWVDESDSDSSTRNMATWEAILDYLYNNKTIEECIKRHTWGARIGQKDSHEITILDNIKESYKNEYLCNK